MSREKYPKIVMPQCQAEKILKGQKALVTGNDPATSVVDAQGKVHGMQNLYVGDGSVLPRASRVNPALTIYAWGLRLGDHLSRL